MPLPNSHVMPELYYVVYLGCGASRCNVIGLCLQAWREAPWSRFPKQTAEHDDGTSTDVAFTLHLARSVAGNWFDNHPDMPSSASSLILAHAAKRTAPRPTSLRPRSGFT
jgi:hypothetical protein